MTAPTHGSLEELLACASAFAQAQYGQPAAHLKLVLADGRKVCLPVPGPAVAPEPLRLSDQERDIIEAIGGPTPLTGDVIADRSGYPCDSGLRSTLAGMRRRGLLTGSKGETGYGVSPQVKI